MTTLGKRALDGAIGGMIGAGVMTLLRLGARRLGLIDTMVPEAVEQRLARGAGLRGGARAHRAAGQALHHAYGAGLGAVLGAVGGALGGPRLARAALLGVGAWGLGRAVLFPALRLPRPAWRAHHRELAVDLAAHLAYAATTLFVTDELARQPTPPSAPHRSIG